MNIDIARELFKLTGRKDKKLLSYVENLLINAQIDENTFYLGYDETVNKCVWRDADNRIMRLKDQKEKQCLD